VNRVHALHHNSESSFRDIFGMEDKVNPGYQPWTLSGGVKCEQITSGVCDDGCGSNFAPS
jgi:hypothetical protein